MSEPAMRRDLFDAQEEEFRAYIRSVKGRGRPLVSLLDKEEHLAFLDAFFAEVNAIEDEPLDGMLMRIPFRQEVDA